MTVDGWVRMLSEGENSSWRIRSAEITCTKISTLTKSRAENPNLSVGSFTLRLTIAYQLWRSADAVTTMQAISRRSVDKS